MNQRNPVPLNHPSPQVSPSQAINSDIIFPPHSTQRVEFRILSIILNVYYGINTSATGASSISQILKNPEPTHPTKSNGKPSSRAIHGEKVTTQVAVFVFSRRDMRTGEVFIEVAPRLYSHLFRPGGYIWGCMTCFGGLGISDL